MMHHAQLYYQKIFWAVIFYFWRTTGPVPLHRLVNSNESHSGSDVALSSYRVHLSFPADLQITLQNIWNILNIICTHFVQRFTRYRTEKSELNLPHALGCVLSVNRVWNTVFWTELITGKLMLLIKEKIRYLNNLKKVMI